MRLFDTHCHFETTDAAEIAAVLARAKEAGVEKILAVGGSTSMMPSAKDSTSFCPTVTVTPSRVAPA